MPSEAKRLAATPGDAPGAPLLLGVDPGFAALGWARLELRPEGVRLAGCGVLRTAKGRASRLASEDNVHRARELWRGLAAVAGAPCAVAVEAQSWPRNAGATAKLGIAWGLVSAFAEAHALPLVHVSPQGLKAAVTGSRTASKADVLCALRDREGFEDLHALLADVPRSQWEHPVDAAAAAVAALDSEIIRAVRSAFARAADSRLPMS